MWNIRSVKTSYKNLPREIVCRNFRLEKYDSFRLKVNKRILKVNNRTSEVSVETQTSSKGLLFFKDPMSCSGKSKNLTDLNEGEKRSQRGERPAGCRAESF